VLDCFVAYLVGHHRPMHEVLFPRLKPMQAIHANEFAGMTRIDVPLADLEETRATTLNELPRRLSTAQREFLLSVARGEPAWDRMPFGRLADLPAVRWKLRNLHTLRGRDRRRFAEQHDLLRARLASPG